MRMSEEQKRQVDFKKAVELLRASKNLMVDDLEDCEDGCNCDWCRHIRETIAFLKLINEN